MTGPPAPNLVLLPKWFGDVVMSAAFVERLRAIAPERPLHAASVGRLADLAALLPGVDRVLPYDPGDWRGPVGAFRLGRALAREGPFNACYCLPRSFRSALVAAGTHAPRRIGYRQEWRSFLLTDPVRPTPVAHRVAAFAALADIGHGSPADVVLPPTRVRLRPPPSSPVADLVGAAPRPVLALHLRSEARARRLSLTKWTGLARQLVPRFAATIVLVGGPADLPTTSSFAEGLPPGFKVIDVCGDASAGQLAGILAQCDALLACDSGPAHLANALGVPTVVLIGASDERVTAPFNADYRTVLTHRGLPCVPCGRNRCRFGTPLCIEDIEDDRIVTATAAAVGSNSPG